MTMMSDLAQDLVEEILSRVPITSLTAVRSTCKRWNGLSTDPSFRKKHRGKAAEELLVIMMNGFKVCLMSVNLNGIHNHKESIKLIGELNQVNVHNAFYGDGLLLCLTKEEGKNTSRLVVWNPYLGQTRWIEPRSTYCKSDMFCIGYNNNHNHKILRRHLKEFEDYSYEIYDFKSNSWRVLTTSYSDTIRSYIRGFSLKGNTYFLVWKRVQVEDDNGAFLLCFDFTRERFEAPLHLPFHCDYTFDGIDLSTVREEQLAVLFQNRDNKQEIWITTKIEPNAVLWNKFLVLDTGEFIGIRNSFLVDEEKKMAVICCTQIFSTTKRVFYHTAYIIGEDGYLKKLDLGESHHYFPILFSGML